MRALFDLIPHDSSATGPISRIIGAVRRDGTRLSISFKPSGAMGDVLWPVALPEGFSDGLWQHTCFEGFVGPVDDTGYVELNMATSGRWAAYRFDGYRAGLRRAKARPRRRLLWYPESRIFMAMFDMPDLNPDAEWRVGVSAVVEATDRTKSYWALAHPPGNPDFHNADCFTIRLPAPTLP